MSYRYVPPHMRAGRKKEKVSLNRLRVNGEADGIAIHAANCDCDPTALVYTEPCSFVIEEERSQFAKANGLLSTRQGALRYSTWRGPNIDDPNNETLLGEELRSLHPHPENFRLRKCMLRDTHNGFTAFVSEDKRGLQKMVQDYSSRATDHNNIADALCVITTGRLLDLLGNNGGRHEYIKLSTEDLQYFSDQFGYNKSNDKSLRLLLRGGSISGLVRRAVASLSMESSGYVICMLKSWPERSLVSPFFGGRRSLGETSRHAATRKTLEETGDHIDVTDDSTLARVHTYCDDQNDLFVFTV